MKLILLLALCVGFLYAQSQTSSPLPVKDAASGSVATSVPSVATFIAGISSGNLKGIIACDSSTFLSLPNTANTELISPTTGKSIYVCALIVGGSNNGTLKFQSSTAVACGGTLTQITSTINYSGNNSLSVGFGIGQIFNSGVSKGLCVTASGNNTSNPANVFISYTVF